MGAIYIHPQTLDAHLWNTWYRYKELAALALLLGLEMVFQFSYSIQSFFNGGDCKWKIFVWNKDAFQGLIHQYNTRHLTCHQNIAFSKLLNCHCQCITIDCAIQEEKEAHGHSQNEFYHVGATCQVRILYLNRKRNFSLLSCDLANLYYKRSL